VLAEEGEPRVVGILRLMAASLRIVLEFDHELALARR
jgi:hypothetical protein